MKHHYPGCRETDQCTCQDIDDADRDLHEQLEDSQALVENTRKQLQSALDKVAEMHTAIKKAVAKYDSIVWGYEGDGGMGRVMSELEESVMEKKGDE
jgi:hypothetical protein